MKPRESGKLFTLNILIYLAVSLLASLAPAVYGFLAAGGGAEAEEIAQKLIESDWFTWGIQVLLYVILGVMLLSLGKRDGVTPAWVGLKKPMPVRHYFFAAGIGISLVFVSSLVTMPWQLLLEAIGFRLPETQINNTVSLVGALLGFVILPSLTEEYLYRGAIFGSLKSGGTKYAIFASALFFSAMHMSLAQLPNTLLCGLLFATVFYVYESLWFTVIIHFFNNLTAVLVTFFNAKFGLDALLQTNAVAMSVYVSAIVVASVAMVCFILHLVRKYREKEKAQSLTVDISEPIPPTKASCTGEILSSAKFGLILAGVFFVLNTITGFLPL